MPTLTGTTHIWPDEGMLDRAGDLHRVIFHHYGSQRRVSIGQRVADLGIVSNGSELSDFVGRVDRLPLR